MLVYYYFVGENLKLQKIFPKQTTKKNCKKQFLVYHTQFSLVHFCLKFLVTQLWAFHKIQVETLSSRIATIQMLSLASGSNFSQFFSISMSQISK